MTEQQPAFAAADRIFAGAGEVGGLLRAIDWADTALGPLETWPQSLRTALSVILRSRFPMFVFWGPELIQIYNDAYIPIPGEKHPESLGRPARETWAEIWDVLGPQVEAVLERGDATWNDDQLLLMDRHGFPEETYFVFSYSPVQDESGGIGGVFCACTETTARVLAARRIRAVRELADHAAGARSPAEAARLAAEVLRQHRRDVPAAAVYLAEGDVARRVAALGVADDSLRLPPTVQLTAPPDGAWPVAEVFATGRAAVVDVRPDGPHGLSDEPWGEVPRQLVLLPVPDPGQRRPPAVLAVAVSPVLRHDRDYEAYHAFLSDTLSNAIADARTRQQEQRRLDALAELNRVKTEFFSNVSHEFRTPLTLLLAPLEEALERGEPVPPRLVGQMHRSARRLLKLVDSLLDFSRIEEGRLRPTFRPTDLTALTSDLAGVFRSAAAKAGLDYRISCDDLPGPVHVDREAWEKIVLNLLSNALKFTDRGSIEVTLSSDGGDAVLAVRDTGVGIADEHLPHLFERFYRVDDVSGRSYEGSGIGLALVHELVRAHGGRVEIDTELGRGTVFEVRVPLGVEHLPEDRVAAAVELPLPAVDRDAYVAEATGWTGPDAAADPGEDADAAESRPVVLVVDDNADIRRYLRELLAAEWRVRTAADGHEALEEIRAERPDLVLTDVMMPRMDGFELIQVIRQDEALQDLPVVVLSARAGEEATADGLGAGADDYVVKPFTADQLRARVRANLEMARLRSSVALTRGRADILAGVSHDMQTPLAVILAAFTELTVADLGDPDLATIVAAARDRALQLRMLVQQFLDHSRLEVGDDLRLRLRAVSLVELVEEALLLATEPDRVEACVDGDLRVVADPERAVQILVNLVENALRYTAGKVAVTGRRDGDHAVVTVDDEGPAVPEAELERIFERFYRGTTAGSTSGSGLGLYVSRAIARLQHGDLHARHEGEGTRLRLELPLAEPHDG